MNLPKVLLSAAVLPAIFAGWYFFKTPPAVDKVAERPRPPVGAPSGARVESFSATGIVKPQVGAEVKVGSQVSGIVVKLNVLVGDKVDRGQDLAQLDDAAFRSAVDLAQAELQSAAAELRYAGKQLAASENLGGVVSQLQLESLRRNADVRKADVARAMARLEDVEYQLGRTRIKSPISGTIASVSTYEGETVAASLTAPTFVTIIDLDRLEVQAFVDETDIRNVSIGQSATFRLEAFPEETLIGTVAAVRPKAELTNNVVNYVVVIDILNRGGVVIRPEMTARVTFERGQRNWEISHGTK